jgi:uncharacterized protein (TIRG00374 family)
LSRAGARLLAGALLAIVLLIVLAQGVDLRRLGDALTGVRPEALLIAAAATVGTYLSRAARLGVLLPVHEVPLGRLVFATYVGYATGLLVPRGGELARAWLVARGHDRLSTSAALAAIVLERILDASTVLLMATLGLVSLSPARVAAGESLPWRPAALAAGLGALAAMVCLVVLCRRSDAAAARIVSWLPPRLAAPLAGAIRDFGAGLTVLAAAPRRLPPVAGLSVLVWLCNAAVVHATNRGLGLDLPFSASFVILALVMIGTALPTPAGLGGYHAGYVLAMTVVLGVDRERALAAAIACHAVTAVAILVPGALMAGLAGLRLAEVTGPAADRS